jgi:gag-polypeptide of LTR copia-type
MSEESSYTSGLYQMELLKAHNWMPWKQRMLAVLRDLGLEKYIAKDAKSPESADRANLTTAEQEEQKRWRDSDAKARTRIELAIGDAEMIHISGADSVREMWDQLTMVKESKGRLGVLATRRALYRMTAEEGFDMVEHISKLRKLQEELHLMENKVPDEDFVMILITSLPESWDQYTSAYLGRTPESSTRSLIQVVAIFIRTDFRGFYPEIGSGIQT